MPISCKIVSSDEWIAYREPWKKETTNVHLIQKFNDTLEPLISKYNGVLVYHKYIKSSSQISGPGVLEYSESSPFARLFKVSPSGYFLNNFCALDLWRKHPIDPNILDNFSNNENKYTQPKTMFEIQRDDYILFTLQSNAHFTPHSFNVRGLFDVVKWANANKRYIYFKLHPFTAKDSHILKIWNTLKDNGYISEYTVLVDKEYNLDHLIDNCSALWTFSSGSAFQAVLKNKPVARFFHDTDFAPITRYAKMPEDASLAMVLSEEDKLRYLSWYYHKLTIDVTSDNFTDRLGERFDQVYNKGLTIDQIY